MNVYYYTNKALYQTYFMEILFNNLCSMLYRIIHTATSGYWKRFSNSPTSWLKIQQFLIIASAELFWTSLKGSCPEKTFIYGTNYHFSLKRCTGWGEMLQKVFCTMTKYVSWIDTYHIQPGLVSFMSIFMVTIIIVRSPYHGFTTLKR